MFRWTYLTALFLQLSKINTAISGHLAMFPSCISLLSEINFTGFRKDTVMHKNGCSLHKYIKEQGTLCLSNEHIAFVGDSRIRRFFDTLSFSFVPGYKMIGKTHGPSYARNKVSNITVDFQFKGLASGVANYMTDLLEVSRNSRPRVTVISVGVWDIGSTNGTEQGERQYTGNLTVAAGYMKKLIQDGMLILWAPQDPIDPIMCKKQPNRWMHSQDKINRYNKIAQNILHDSGVQIWESLRQTGEYFSDWHVDCVHIVELVDEYKSQVLLNWLCNKKMNYTDGTCCRVPNLQTVKPPPPVSVRHIVTAAPVEFLLRPHFYNIDNNFKMISLVIIIYSTIQYQRAYRSIFELSMNLKI